MRQRWPCGADRYRGTWAAARLAGAVEEIVRYFGGGPGFVRVATTDTEIAGQPVMAGEYVVAAVRSANHDPQVFAEPGRLDVSRPVSAHLGFGFGPHQCPGQQIGRLELSVVQETVLRRVPSLSLAVPQADIEFKVGAAVPGPAALPVTWDTVLPASRTGPD